MKKLLLLLLQVTTIAFSFGQTAEEYNKMAEKKIELKDFKYAMVLMDKAIALDKKNQWYILRKAEIQFALSGPLDALNIIKSAILIDKTLAEPYSRAGYYYDSRGMADSAILMYNEAINHASDDSTKYTYIMNRGVAKLGKRDFEGAVKDFENVLMFNPVDIAALNNVSACYGDLGMLNKSIESLKKLSIIDPMFSGSYINLGFTYSEIDSFDLALNYFSKALELDPKEPTIYNNRGYVYYKKGEFTNALNDINLSIKMYSTNSYAYRNLALVYIAMKKIEEACTVLGYARDYGFEDRYGPEVSELLMKHCKK